MIAHVWGLPVEELAAVVSGGAGLVLARLWMVVRERGRAGS